jgi:hypothetical protein
VSTPCIAALAQIALQKIDFTSAEMLPNIPDMSAGQIGDDAYFRSSRQQLVRQRRPDERSAAGDQRKLAGPKCFCGCHG